MRNDSNADELEENTERSSPQVTRRNWIQMASATGVTALAGCSGDGDGGDNGTTTGDSNQVTTLEFWRWPHSTEPSNTAEDEIVKAFNEGPGAEQGIKVEQVKNPFNDHNTALRSAIGSGDAPDIAWGYPVELYEYSGKSKSEIKENAPYAYLDDYIDDEFRNQFYDPVWDWQEQRFSGSVGVPFIATISPGLMYVNVDAWNEAGLGDMPEGSWSYEEYLNAVEQIHGTQVNGSTVNGTGVALSAASSRQDWREYLMDLSRTAGSIIGLGYENKDDESVLTVASEPELEAWNNFVGKPIENGWTNNPSAYGYIEKQEPFIAGQIGMMKHESFTRIDIAENADFEYDIIPFPTKGGKKNYGVYDTAGFDVMFMAFDESVGGNPEAASEFIKFRNNARNQYNWFNVSAQSVPNQGAYKLMQEEGVSDTVKQTRGLQVMDRVNEAMLQHKSLQEEIINRYPDIKMTEAGSPVTTVPQQVGSGRVHDAIGGALQKLAQNNNENPKELITNAEKTWGKLIEDSENLAVDKDSIGYNKPEPQAGQLK